MMGANVERRKTAIQRVFSIVSSMEAEPLRAWLASDAVMEFPYAFGDLPTRIVGQDAIVAAMSATRQSFASFKLTPTAFFSSPAREAILVEARSEGNRLDGTEYSNRYIMIFMFRDNKIILWREFFDPMKVGALRSIEPKAIS